MSTVWHQELLSSPAGSYIQETASTFLKYRQDCVVPFMILEDKANQGDLEDAENQICRGGAAFSSRVEIVLGTGWWFRRQKPPRKVCHFFGGGVARDKRDMASLGGRARGGDSKYHINCIASRCFDKQNCLNELQTLLPNNMRLVVLIDWFYIPTKPPRNWMGINVRRLRSSSQETSRTRSTMLKFGTLLLKLFHGWFMTTTKKVIRHEWRRAKEDKTRAAEVIYWKAERHRLFWARHECMIQNFILLKLREEGDFRRLSTKHLRVLKFLCSCLPFLNFRTSRKFTDFSFSF